MKAKIAGIFVCMLLITTALTAVATPTIEKEFGQTWNETIQNTLIEINPGVKLHNKNNNDYVPGEFIVKFRPNLINEFSVTEYNIIQTGIPSIDTLNEKYHVRDANRLFSTEKIYTDPYGLCDIVKFTVPQTSDIISIISDYYSDPLVIYAEPNYKIKMSLTPNDSQFAVQWALHNTGQTGGLTDCDIDAPEAWDIETGDENIVIAIHDTGVDWDHPDLEDNIWINDGEDLNHNGEVDPTDFNGIDDDANGFIDDIRGWDFVDTNDTVYPGEDGTIRDNNPMDFHGHGTHCSGIAGAMTDNYLGIAGVCWNSKIMAIRAGYTTDVYGGWLEVDDALAGIQYAADNGADILSMSWGTYEQIQSLEDVINYAYSKGVNMVAAGGNEGVWYKSYPTSYPNVVGVAATDHSDKRAFWSNYGSWVDIAAPGVNIVSTIFNDTYYTWSGTSMATPLVAGVIGLMLSNTPGLSQQEVLTIVRSTADPVNSDRYIGPGRVNAFTALHRSSAPLVELDHTIDDAHVAGELEIFGSANGSTFTSYTLSYGKGAYPTEWIELATATTPINNDLIAEIDTTLLEEDESYALKLEVEDNNGFTFQDCLIFIADNEAQPPTGYEIQWNIPFGGGYPHQVMPIGDIDEDGENEILVGYWNGHTAGMLFIMTYDEPTNSYIEEHSWTVPPASGGTARWPTGASVIDLDSDGDLEFCISWVHSAANGIYALDWDGTTLTQLDYYNGTGFDAVYSTYPCDYDDDGDTELLLANAPFEGPGDKHVTALGWDSNSDTFTEEAFWSLDGHLDKELWGIYSGDIDNDDKTEVVVTLTAATTAGTWALHWNEMENTWDEEPICIDYTIEKPGPVAIGDLNNNGIPEIGVGSAFHATAWLYEWNNGVYDLLWNQSYSNDGIVFYPVDIADADNDGINEFLIGTDTVHIIQWQDNEYIEETVLTDPPNNVMGLHVGDLDNDNENEILTGCCWSGAGGIFVYQYVGIPQLELNISGGIGITTEIHNTGDLELTNIAWELNLEGGFVFPKQKTGTIPKLEPGQTEEIKTILFGLGKPTITVTATTAEDIAAEKQEEKFILLILTFPL